MGGTALHQGAVPVSLSATARPVQNGPGRHRPGLPVANQGHGESGVVVRLELPGPGTKAPAGVGAPALDPDRLARAVEDLIRAIDPTLASAHVEVELIRPAPAVEPSPLAAPVADPASDQALDLGLDLHGRSLSVDGRVVVLTRREFDLLAYLHDRRGVALSRRELMTAVWHTGYLIGDRTIDVHVRRLRVKLGRHADRLTTLRGYGYRLD